MAKKKVVAKKKVTPKRTTKKKPLRRGQPCKGRCLWVWIGIGRLKWVKVYTECEHRCQCFDPNKVGIEGDGFGDTLQSHCVPRGFAIECTGYCVYTRQPNGTLMQDDHCDDQTACQCMQPDAAVLARVVTVACESKAKSSGGHENPTTADSCC